MSLTIDPTGAAGHGFISSSAGPLLLIAVVASMFAVPAVRDAVGEWLTTAREHFFGPAQVTQFDADSAAENGAPGEATGAPFVRASSRDKYTFNLDLEGEEDF